MADLLERKKVIFICNTQIRIIKKTIEELPPEKKGTVLRFKEIIHFYEQINREVNKKEPSPYLITAYTNIIKKNAKMIDYLNFIPNFN